MTKLQLLNAYLTERLTVVVKEILDVVEDTVTEYREETARTKRENESLRRQLRDILLLEAETEWLSKGRASQLAPRRAVRKRRSKLRWKNVEFKLSKRVNVKYPLERGPGSVYRVETEPFLNSAQLKHTDPVHMF